MLTRQFAAHDGKLLHFLWSSFTGGLIKFIIIDKISKNLRTSSLATFNCTVGEVLLEYVPGLREFHIAIRRAFRFRFRVQRKCRSTASRCDIFV